MELRSALPAAVVVGSLLGAVVVTLSPPEGVVGRTQAFGAVHTIAAGPVRWDLPVVWNSSVERFVDLFRDEQPDRMALYLKRSGRYEGMIRSKLRQQGMPEDLLYLSMIESGFLPSARSRVGAVGLWQFMAGTARDYGLRVDSYVDERRDPERSTDAALHYMQDLYARFGSWNLVAAAYNSGGNRVARIMVEQTGSERGDERAFWRIRRLLPADTREYVPLIFAAAIIGKEPHKYGLGDVERWLPFPADTVQVPGGTDLGVVARASQVKKNDLLKLNPQLIRGMTPPGGSYAVRIPNGRAAAFARNFPTPRNGAKTAEAEAKPNGVASTGNHQVKAGETLVVIARRNSVSVRALQLANDMGKRTLLHTGQVLRLPTPE